MVLKSVLFPWFVFIMKQGNASSHLNHGERTGKLLKEVSNCLRRTGFLNLRVLLSACGRRSHWCGVPAALGTSLSTSMCLQMTLPSPSLKDVLAARRVLCWLCCLLGHFKHTLALHSVIWSRAVGAQAQRPPYIWSPLPLVSASFWWFCETPHHC